MINQILKNYHDNCHNVINVMLEARRQELNLSSDGKILYYLLHDDEKDKQTTTFKIGEIILLIVIWQGLKCTMIYPKNSKVWSKQ